MTDAAAEARRDADAHLAWRIGGTLLLASAAVNVIVPFVLGSPLVALASWIGIALFSAALVVFAFGVRRAGSVVARKPLGMVALVILAIWPIVNGIVQLVVPPSIELVSFFMGWGTVTVAVEVFAAIVAVVVIARSGAVPSPWRWAPAWALAAAIAPQLILRAVAASPGADVQAIFGPMAGLTQLVSIAAPLCLGLCAILLAQPRREAPAVQVYPPVG